MLHSFRVPVLALLAITGLVGPAHALAPTGQATWAVHISLAPVYFEPAEAPGIVTPFMVFNALRDAGGAVWANEIKTDTVVRLDPKTDQLRVFALPSKDVGIRKMIVDAAGRLGVIE